MGITGSTYFGVSQKKGDTSLGDDNFSWSFMVHQPVNPKIT
jgi:hypothetical protein